MKLPLLNLHARRLREWKAVIARESISRPLPLVAWHIARSLLRNLRHHDRSVPLRSLWRRRIRHCSHCVAYDHALHACRNTLDGDPIGCGCDVVLLALVRRPYPLPGCWIDQALPDHNLGWKSLELSPVSNPPNSVP